MRYPPQQKTGPRRSSLPSKLDASSKEAQPLDRRGHLRCLLSFLRDIFPRICKPMPKNMFVVQGGAKRCAQTLRHTASTEEKRERLGGLGSQDALVRTGQDGPGIDASASWSGISDSLQQRGGAGPGPQVKLPNSRKPSAMNHQVTEASIIQSRMGGGERKLVTKSMHKSLHCCTKL